MLSKSATITDTRTPVYQALKGKIRPGAPQPAEPRQADADVKGARPSPRSASSSRISSTAKTSASRSASASARRSSAMSSTSCSASDRSRRCSRTRRSPTSWSTSPRRSSSSARAHRGDGHRLPRRQAPDADHRADRQRRRPAHRRVHARWSTRACRTAPASTSSSRRWRSTARRCRFAVSAPTGSAPRIWSRVSRSPRRC